MSNAILEADSSKIKLTARIRDQLGTGATRLLRRQGMIPAIIYGAGKNSVTVSLVEKEIMKYYRKPQFISTVFEIKTESETYSVLPKMIDLDPITDIVRHLDFVYLNDNIQKMEIPLVFENRERSLGVKRGGYFNIIKRTLTMLCPVNNIPRKIVIDTTNMQIGYSFKAHNLKIPSDCELVNKSNFVIASVTGRGGKSETEDTEAVAAKE